MKPEAVPWLKSFPQSNEEPMRRCEVEILKGYKQTTSMNVVASWSRVSNLRIPASSMARITKPLAQG